MRAIGAWNRAGRHASLADPPKTTVREALCAKARRQGRGRCPWPIVLDSRI